MSCIFINKAFDKNLEAHGIGFDPPSPEQRQEKPWSETNTVVDKTKEEVSPENKTKEAKKAKDKEPVKKEADSKKPPVQDEDQGDGHKVAGLSCKDYGGPSDEDAAEMVFWRDIPEDAGFVSPYKRNETQYLTFEPGTCCTVIHRLVIL